MNYLLDTHVLLWLLNDETQIPDATLHALKQPENALFFSIVSLWEIAIKKSLGKLSLTHSVQDVERELLRLSIVAIPIQGNHISYLETLPFHHRNPFDRMLIAQAMTENLTLVSKDSVFPTYAAPVQWF
ncbi:type II toxin-antitoxin system VapC family toxin [Tellurirhabdus rosea]|uniref:type II toxin-antitoxin system VapC family toxin n=1 Tax=Tellurirhabdus rosea TaxID=2674997 RepID=UPI00224E77CD|nr:type II toxin-antitoxin system VapC family toxin [Tellurirhabdus rosea]